MAKLPVHVSDQEIINALEKFSGNYRMAANKLKISYGTIIKRATQNPEIKQCRLDMIGDRDAYRVEMAESNLDDLLEQGDFKATKMVLERLSREKWGNKPQIVEVQEDYPEPIGDFDGN